jgi:hypothetical protein
MRSSEFELTKDIIISLLFLGFAVAFFLLSIQPKPALSVPYPSNVRFDPGTGSLIFDSLTLSPDGNYLCEG